jgi:hypothetical protein
LRLNDGVPGRSAGPGRVELAWIVRGDGPVTVRYTAKQADDLELKIDG